MTETMSSSDRAARALLIAPAATIATLAFGATTIAGVVLLVLAVVMVSTAAVGFCPLYALFGIDTRRRRPLVHRLARVVR